MSERSKSDRNLTEKCTEKCACGNHARIGESTCNACRPKESLEAERAAKAKGKEEEDRLNETIETVEASLAKRCPCGNMSRLFKSYDDFASLHNFEDDNDASVKRYAAAMTATLTKDRRCNTCFKSAGTEPGPKRLPSAGPAAKRAKCARVVEVVPWDPDDEDRWFASA